jgi:hypothetical protein
MPHGYIGDMEKYSIVLDNVPPHHHNLLEIYPLTWIKFIENKFSCSCSPVHGS